VFQHRNVGRWSSKRRADVSLFGRRPGCEYPGAWVQSGWERHVSQGPVDGAGERSLLLRFPKGSKALWRTRPSHWRRRVVAASSRRCQRLWRVDAAVACHGFRFGCPTVSPHERGMERGRLLSPLPKMARYDRAHLVSLTNDLWVLFYGDNIREFLTLAPHPALSLRSL